jgi:hypothetical protein
VDRELEDLAAVIADADGSADVFGMSAGTVLALDAAARPGGRRCSARVSGAGDRCAGQGAPAPV